MKKVWKYLIITLLLLLGLCCVGILYIFFVPNSNLFGICYVSYNDKIQSEKYDITGIREVSLKSNKYDVNIKKSSDDNIYLSLYSNSFGFTHLDYKDVSIDSSSNNGILSFEVNEPKGVVTSNGSYIDLFIPEKIIIDLSLKNDRSTTTFESSDILTGILNYKTNNGSLNLSNSAIFGVMNLDLGNSDLYIGEDSKLFTNDVNLKITTGKFDASKVALGDVKVLKNSRGVIKIGSCSNFTENIKSAGGKIDIQSVENTLKINTSDTNVYVDTIKNNAIIDLGTGSGNVKIKNINGESNITTLHGNITIENCTENITISTTYGNVNIKNAYKYININSLKSSNINVSYNESSIAHNSTTSPNTRKLDVKMRNGNLTANRVDNTIINVIGNAHLDISLSNVSASNTINVGYGSAYIVVNKDSNYLLTSNTTKGSTRVNLSQISEYGGCTENITATNPLHVNNYSDSHNQLNVSATSGQITIIDTNLVTI